MFVEVLLLVALIVFALPVLAYFTVKFGTYAHLRAKWLFDQERKEENNGDQTAAKREEKKIVR